MLRRLTALLAVIAALAVTPVAQAHYRPGMHNQMHAIVWGFCHGRDNLSHPCRYGREALVVAEHESASYWDEGRCWEAVNGQYLGCLQMGAGERRTYGDYHDPWHQARAAYNYFAATHFTWSPWSCKPSGYCYN